MGGVWAWAGYHTRRKQYSKKVNLIPTMAKVKVKTLPTPLEKPAKYRTFAPQK
jgi:hypothetical protein